MHAWENDDDDNKVYLKKYDVRIWTAFKLLWRGTIIIYLQVP
jgi:hypothetical protein